MIRGIIVCDNDGTLLPFGESELKQDVIDMIHGLINAGYLFCVASGRPYNSLMRFYEPVKKDIIFIPSNGAEIYENGNCIVGPKFMDRAIAQEVVSCILARPENVLTITGEHSMFLYGNRINKRILYINNTDVQVISDFSEIDQGILQISIFNSINFQEQIEYMKSRFSGRINIFPSGPEVADITPNNKGDGLRNVAERYGVAMEDTYAFGDSYNDLPMLKVAGHGYLMDSADDDIKRIFLQSCGCVADICKTLL